MNENQNNNSNGFSSREILHQLWNKMDSIELKLDTKLADIDRRVIVLELETIRRDGPLSQFVHSMEERIKSLETINTANNQVDSVLSSKKSEGFTKKNIVIGAIASLVFIGELILNLVQLFR